MRFRKELNIRFKKIASGPHPTEFTEKKSGVSSALN